MGHLEGAIAKKAESLYGTSSEEDQRRVQQIFLRLVRPGEGEADTRRRAMLAELGEEVRGLAKTLADERLLVTSRLAGSAEETIEVSHEALIRHWERLKTGLTRIANSSPGSSASARRLSSMKTAKGTPTSSSAGFHSPKRGTG